MSLLLRSLRKIAVSYDSSKSFARSTVRWNTFAAQAFKGQRAQANKEKQPVEVFKWILLAIPVTSFGLGCWQVYRLQWKIKLIDMLHAKTNASVNEMPSEFRYLDDNDILQDISNLVACEQA